MKESKTENTSYNKVLLSFVILTWNSEKSIADCLESIIIKTAKEKLPVEIYIVDNGSEDSTQDTVKFYQRKYPEIINIIFLEKNFGTTYPRNLALKRVKGQYICILDSDTRFMSGNFYEALEYLKKNDYVGILAPMLTLRNGEIQNSVKKFPSFMDKIQKIWTIIGKKTIENKDFYKNFPFNEITDVDTAISACWIFEKKLLFDIGYLDEKIFYSPEDLDYCMRVWKSNKKVVFYPNIEILHVTQQITHKNPFGLIAISHFMGLLYYFRKHGSWFSTGNIYKYAKK
jgi:GT2 family glycosyltransferase